MTSEGLSTHQQTKEDWHYVLHPVRKEMVDTAILLLLLCVFVCERDTVRLQERGKNSVKAKLNCVRDSDCKRVVFTFFF